MVKLVVGNIEKNAGGGSITIWGIHGTGRYIGFLSVASVRNFPNNYSTQLKKYSLNSFS